jgi:cytochrome c551/c552
VIFPSAGSWRYVVDDGFSARHSFGPVRVAERGAGAKVPLAAAIPATGDPAVAPTALEGSSGGTIFARMGCGSCHVLAAAGSRGEIGPDLDRRLPGHTRASLVERITRGPAADGTFSPMPDNFGERLSDGELDSLVDFLLAARSAR